MAGPFDWKYTDRSFNTDTFPPKLLLQGHMAMPGNEEAFTIDADFIEWLYSGGSARHKVKKGPVYITHLPQRPHVTQWDIDHDKSMHFSAGSLRFNWKYVMGFALSHPAAALVCPVDVRRRHHHRDAAGTQAPRRRFLELVKLIEVRAKQDPHGSAGKPSASHYSAMRCFLVAYY